MKMPQEDLPCSVIEEDSARLTAVWMIDLKAD